MSDFKRIAPDLAQQLRESGAQVVDIRDPQSYAMGHISGSRHIDNYSVADFIRDADMDAPLVVVCYHGNSSQSAAAYSSSRASPRSTASTAVSNCGAASIPRIPAPAALTESPYGRGGFAPSKNL